MGVPVLIAQRNKRFTFRLQALVDKETNDAVEKLAKNFDMSSSAVARKLIKIGLRHANEMNVR
jgi:hypothetical protein